MEKVTLKDIYDAIGELRNEIASRYVTKDEFGPIKSLVYGVAGLMLTAIVLAVVDLIINK